MAILQISNFEMKFWGKGFYVSVQRICKNLDVACNCIKILYKKTFYVVLFED